MRALYALAAVLVCSVCFALGRMTAKPSVELVLRRDAGVLELYRGGELIAEYEPNDGEIYFELASAIDDVPTSSSLR